MNQTDAAVRARNSLTAHSLGRVFVVSLAMTLALPVTVIAVAHPGVAIAFGAGLLTRRVRFLLARSVGWVKCHRADGGWTLRPTSD